MRRTIVLLGALFLLAACQTNPVTGRNQLALVPEDQVIEASAQAYTQQVSEYRKKGEVNTDPRTVERVQRIANRIVEQAVKIRPETRSWQWQITVIDDPQVNAFAMAGGKMAVYTGLIQKLAPTDDELAQVLAHEVSHALSGHTREKMSVAMGTDVALNVFGAVRGASEATMQGLATAAQLAVQLPNSRKMESEADRIGIELAAKAGYDPHAAVTLWQKMGRLNQGGPPQFLSTHPSDETRLRALNELVPKMMPYYQAARH